MDPDRKRKIRLGIALGTAVVLAAALVYVSFSASSEAKPPSAVLAAAPGSDFEVYGVVAEDSVSHEGEELRFDLADREDPSESLPVSYVGQVPDPFREGREVIIEGEFSGETFVGERDSLITKCPSKFADEAANDDQILIE